VSDGYKDNLPVPFPLDKQVGPYWDIGVTELNFSVPSYLGQGAMPVPNTSQSADAPVITAKQIVSLHTYSGVQQYQFLSSELINLSWSRESRDTSRCELSVPGSTDYEALPDLIPWLHWVSVWDETGQELYWTGPIQKLTANRDSLTISARDISALFSRTRCPMTKRWDVSDPADIAEELVKAMIEHHNINTAPVVRHDPMGDKFDFSVKSDEVMLDRVMDDLVQLGLYWTVVGGVIVLGPMPRTAVVALSEHDFVGGGMSVVRDGSATYNDILLRSADNLARAVVPMGGLNLQTIVNIDSMFGVSNTDRAAKQYARHVSVIHDGVSLPDTAVLHPFAPVKVGSLVSSSRFIVDAFGLIVPMELVGIDVSFTEETSSVSVRMIGANDDLPELVRIQDKASISGGD
jgi:hypothetical protein